MQTEGKVEIEISYATAFARQFGQRLLLDPVVYVEMLFEKRALLLDLGDITFLPPRKIHRIEHLFLSRTCISTISSDSTSFCGCWLAGKRPFTSLGPSEFIERVAHKLHGYEWNLADLFQYDLGFAVTELDVSRTARFRLKNAFTAEPLGARRLPEQVIHSEPRLPPSISGTHVRFGSLADITARSRHVRFTPDSGH